ncbi:MAG: alanine/ornithine racemase family PLP-dependent enzyme [Haloplasmataceae bacterium]|jgi:predicted amino acid racemase|nr:alanine/ornithine racemase family PLP-dependent enzyme [Haloplasmataceae bacterium]
MYPRLEIDLCKLRHNTKAIVKKCSEVGVNSIFLVTKVLAGDHKIIEALVNTGVTHLADSRMGNLKKFQIYKLPKVLLRLPMECEIEDTIKYVDISCNSELDTIKKLNNEAIKQEKTHHIILMFDLGDLREGIWYKSDYDHLINEIIFLSNIKLIGIGTNLTCYGGVIPTESNLGELLNIKNNIESKYQIKLDIISGGNSSSIPLILNGLIPNGINNLRLGESIYLGKETAFSQNINDLYQDCFELHAQIIELKDKPSVPIGELGMDAFGNKVNFIDKGIIKRAILGMGKQDVYPNNIIPIDENVVILGASSDHLILDVSKSSYKLGDVIKFKVNYGGLLQLMTSKYVQKIYYIYL